MTDAPSASGDALARALAPNVVVPQEAVDLHPVRWSSVEPVAGDAAVLVHATLTGGPPCSVLARVDLDETPDAVTIGLWAGRRPDADCGDGRVLQLAFPIVTRVALRGPLGDRRVEDGTPS